MSKSHQNRRAAHAQIAMMIWHSMVDGNFSGSKAAEDVASGALLNHIRLAGETYESFMKQQTDAAERIFRS